ncbi:MAG: hypothetical protein ABR915_20410 [Thermoguttaceae bacterium]
MSGDPNLHPSSFILHPSEEPPLSDDWELDEHLRHVARVLRTGKTDKAKGPTGRSMPVRLDGPHEMPSARHSQPDCPDSCVIEGGQSHFRADASRPCPKIGTVSGQPALGAFTWMSLLLGTMALVCGGILLGWSTITGRRELWTLGTPIALGGQIALLIGLVLQLERLWSDSRRAASQLEKVDLQLHELRTTTTLLGTAHGPSAAFYAHLAGGAGPELLLSDLKGQLDLLAVRLAQEK